MSEVGPNQDKTGQNSTDSGHDQAVTSGEKSTCDQIMSEIRHSL